MPLPLERGGAVGIDLRVSAKVKLIDEGVGGEIRVRRERFEDFSLVKAVVETIKDKFGLDFGVKVRIDSEIPVGGKGGVKEQFSRG